MDRVEVDGMQLAFEHRHSIHAAHPSSSLSFEPEGENRKPSAEAEADQEDAVADRAQEQGRARGSMHATTARNNGYLRYLHGARLFQRRSNGRGRESQHILRVTSQMSARDEAVQSTPKCSSGDQAPPDPWLMSNGLGPPPAVQGEAGSYAGGGVLLSILALVHVEEKRCERAFEHNVHDGSRSMLMNSHPHLEALVELVRQWHPDDSVRASLGVESTVKHSNRVSIEFLVAADCCQRLKACLTSDGSCEHLENEHHECAGFQHRVRNSLLDASSGRFVVWAVPSEIQEVGAETWLASVLSSPLLHPAPAEQENGSIEAEEWNMSVFEAAAVLYDRRQTSAGVRNACSWQSIGPLLRPLALFVRFRNVLPADDVEDGLLCDDNLWSVRLAHVWHLHKLWPPKPSMRELEERTLGQLTESDHLQRFCKIIAAASSDVINMASTSNADSEIGRTDQAKQGPVEEGLTQLSHLLWFHPASFSRHMDAEGSTEEDDDVRGIWATPEEHARSREVLFSALNARSIDQQQESLAHTVATGSSGNRPKIVIHRPEDGGDLVFDTFEDKAWTVRATIEGFEMGVDVGYACVYLDGLYKGCSVDEDLMLVFDDPGLDFSWHLLEVRLLDGQDKQVAPSAVSEFRAGVRPCSPPLTEHIVSLVGQGLVWQTPLVTGEETQEATSPRITCVSSLSQALHQSVHLPAQPYSFVAHESLWADEESFAAVTAFANYRRWWTAGAMASRTVSVSPAKNHEPLLLHRATIFYPGLVLAPSLANRTGIHQAESVGRVLYNLRGPCDDRNLFAVVPSGPGRLNGDIVGAIVVQQIWGDSFYHWMIECLPRLAAIPSDVLHNTSIALLVPTLDEFICESLKLLGIQHSRLRVLNHATYYMIQDVWLPPPGVCGLGPATMLLRNMNRMLRSEIAGEESAAVCLVVQRKRGGGREVTNLDELLRALHLLPSSCAGRWQVVSPVDEPGSMLHVARLFARALVVIAPHGGTLANLLFSRASGGESGTHERRASRATEVRVLELLPANRPNLCYERLCRSLGLRYMGFVVPGSSYNQPLQVHVARVLVALQALLAS